MATMAMSKVGVHTLRHLLIEFRKDAKRRQKIWKSDVHLRAYYEGQDKAFKAALRAVRGYMRDFRAAEEYDPPRDKDKDREDAEFQRWRNGGMTEAERSYYGR